MSNKSRKSCVGLTTTLSSLPVVLSQIFDCLNLAWKAEQDYAANE
jgi:hypothetical protein